MPKIKNETRTHLESASRLIIEANYNLGVIEELLKSKDSLYLAYEHYQNARFTKYFPHLTMDKLPLNFRGVEVLSRFSAVMVGIKIHNDELATSKKEKIKKAFLLDDIKWALELINNYAAESELPNLKSLKKLPIYNRISNKLKESQIAIEGWAD